MQAYQIVQKARALDRISTLDVIQTLCETFIECKGDRFMKEDAAMIGGVGFMNGQPLTVIGIQKGHTTKENIKRNFGSSGPAGYRKAQRLMRQAEKFQRPILTLINTSGAACTPDSEEFGIGEAIAQTLCVMSQLTVPTIAIILGEGGSGGAIALALADRVWMLQNSIYSILSPEGFASILWKDAKLAAKAAEQMKLTAQELLELGVIDDIIEEGELSQDILLERLNERIQLTFTELAKLSPEQRVSDRYKKFRQF